MVHNAAKFGIKIGSGLERSRSSIRSCRRNILVEDDSVEIGGAKFCFGLGRLIGRETGREGRLRISQRGDPAYVVEPGI